MKPNWKHAPAWATRLMLSNGTGEYAWADDGLVVCKVGGCNPFTMSRDLWTEIERRPTTQWDGQGLPPVGTECEVLQPDTWVRCTILAVHVNSSGSTDVIYSYGDDWAFQSKSRRFRPIRTAEQIAAAEREVGIAEIRQALVTSAKGSIESTIWDAGYRKQVTP